MRRESSASSFFGRKLRVSDLTIGFRSVKLVQVESYVVANSGAGLARHAELQGVFQQEVVLVGYNGARPRYFGDPQLVQAVMRMPKWRFNWQDVAVTPPPQPSGGTDEARIASR